MPDVAATTFQGKTCVGRYGVVNSDECCRKVLDSGSSCAELAFKRLETAQSAQMDCRNAAIINRAIRAAEPRGPERCPGPGQVCEKVLVKLTCSAGDGCETSTRHSAARAELARACAANGAWVWLEPAIGYQSAFCRLRAPFFLVMLAEGQHLVLRRMRGGPGQVVFWSAAGLGTERQAAALGVGTARGRADEIAQLGERGGRRGLVDGRRRRARRGRAGGADE